MGETNETPAPGPSDAARAGGARLSAPGKLMLAGEYAVLEPGRAALVAAVDRTLSLSLRPTGDATLELWHKPSLVALQGELTGDVRAPVRWIGGVPGELRFAARGTELGLRLCAEEGRPLRGFYSTFENDFALAPAAAGPESSAAQPAQKPGLGGSAASTVLAVRAACLAQQRFLSPRETLALAAAAHWVEQGGSGSGADVAASSLGGALSVHVRRVAASAGALWSSSALSMLAEPLLETAPLSLPADLRLLAVWAGEPADTRALVRSVREFAAGDPAGFRRCIDRITASAQSLQSSLGAAARNPDDHASRAAALASVRAAAVAMAALGEESLTEIVTREHVEIAGIAASCGCAAKPSGAGGGDCAVVFAFGNPARDRVQRALHARGILAHELYVASSV